jgi:adenylosuccinate synthase
MAILSLVGAQWGDEGKGKIGDVLAERADAVVRYNGGDNAGHTIVTDAGTLVFHIVPCGALRKGVRNVIAAGTVINPQVLQKELDQLKEMGHTQDPSTLTISPKAHIITDLHIQYERWIEEQLGKDRLDTTLRGIGPAYALKALRLNLRAGELRQESTIRTRIPLLAKILRSSQEDSEKVVDYLLGIREWFTPFLGDDRMLILEALKEDRRMLFEGAQGALLDIDHGTYPFVTSSNTLVGAGSASLGIPPWFITHSIGMIKAYTTRVGAGPFPTELEDELGEQLREKGGEYGATTRRPRRCGWFDAVMAGYSSALNGWNYLAVTKMDVLDGFETIKICTGYKLNGKEIDYFPCEADDLAQVEPVYEEMSGWRERVAGKRSFDELPKEAQDYLKRISEVSGAPLAIISTGSHRDETIILEDVWK